jgi:retron-type reverse transcriptase
LAIPLCFIINCSISSGKFPERWKQSKLVPLHKKGDTHMVENYRPVSNLCVISKVIERVVHDQISKHCQKEGIIPTSQHGFQRGKSTLTATISMFDQWQQAMENEQSSGVMLFDLSSAFDTLDHDILTRKLSSLNFCAHSVKWVTSFLKGRVQQVVVGKTLSPEINLSVGVPQGSVLSPLLFLLYISDIGEWIKSATITGYADDTSLTMSSQDMTSLLKNLETEANSVLQYMAVNKLVANPGKTKFLLIRGKSHKKWPEVSIKVGNKSVKESPSETVLGIIVNNKLQWHEQHTKVVNKLRSQIGLLARLVFHLPRKALISLLDGLVFSSVRYCLPLWGSMRLEDESGSQWPKSVQVEINNALRVALGYRMEDRISINDLHDKTGSLSYNQLVIQSTQKLTEAILKGDCSGLMDFYSTEEPIRTTRSSERGDLPTTISKTGFRHQSSRLWNSLSDKTLPKKLLGNYPL